MSIKIKQKKTPTRNMKDETLVSIIEVILVVKQRDL